MLFAPLIVSLFAHATPTADVRDVSALLKPIRAEFDVPGMVCVVVEAGQITARGAEGLRKRGGTEALTIDDKIHIGSNTKSMTATLCALLVEEKKLAWDAKVVDAFPELATKIDPGWRDVRLQQLLTNHGGAPAELSAGGLWTKLWSHTGTPREQRMALVTGVLSRPPEAPPGTKFIYSNAGFSIAGAMAERALDAPYEDLMRKYLFAPLSMKSAGFGAPGSRAQVDQPRGHTSNGKPVEVGPAADNPIAIQPAGRVHCSLPDWAKYVTAHLLGEKDADDGTKHILSATSFVKLHTPLVDDASKYAMGWIASGKAPERRLWHNGSNTMWYAEATLALDEGWAVLVAVNQGGDPAQHAAEKLTALLIDQLSKTKAPK
ncbi:MAG: serine hydrolase domain-containing protein [Planctomycetota bacterium]|nr:serine hydrolase domain-containing protein [Planctomycetota bacterium]